MKNEERDQVIATLADKSLKPAKKFNALLGLFRTHPQHPVSTMRHLNAAGFTPMNLSHLEYDIKKLYGVNDADVSSATVSEVATKKAKKEKKTNPKVAKLAPVKEKTKQETPASKEGMAVDYDALSYNDLKAAAAELASKTGEAPVDQKKATLLEYLKKKE